MSTQEHTLGNGVIFLLAAPSALILLTLAVISGWYIVYFAAAMAAVFATVAFCHLGES